jgi:integrase/recombinase XerD
MKELRVEVMMHRNQKRIGLFFRKDQELIAMVRTIPGCKWSATKKCWHIPFFDNYITSLNSKFHNKIKFTDFSRVTDTGYQTVENKQQLEKEITIPQAFFDQVKIRRLSSNTLSAYKSVLTKYLKYCETQKITPSPGNIRQYMIHLIDRHNISRSYQNQLINAAKIYFGAMQDVTIDPVYFQRVKKEKKLPVVFSEDEVRLLLRQVKNLKHRCIKHMSKKMISKLN